MRATEVTHCDPHLRPARPAVPRVGGRRVIEFLYDGDELVAEDGASEVRRYVHGAGVDDPLIWYDGATLVTPRYLHSDHQGSITGIAAGTGAILQINSYDEYGLPSATRPLKWVAEIRRRVGEMSAPKPSPKS